jgi:hypothetical protein
LTLYAEVDYYAAGITSHRAPDGGGPTLRNLTSCLQG